MTDEHDEIASPVDHSQPADPPSRMDSNEPRVMTPREMQDSVDEIMRSVPSETGKPRIVIDPVDVCTINYMKPEDELLTPDVQYSSEYGDGMVLLTNEHWNAVVQEIETLRKASNNAPCTANEQASPNLGQAVGNVE